MSTPTHSGDFLLNVFWLLVAAPSDKTLTVRSCSKLFKGQLKQISDQTESRSCSFNKLKQFFLLLFAATLAAAAADY